MEEKSRNGTFRVLDSYILFFSSREPKALSKGPAAAAGTEGSLRALVVTDFQSSFSAVDTSVTGPSFEDTPRQLNWHVRPGTPTTI